jgi:hypothetical protein
VEESKTTDVILEKDGEYIHYYIADNHPAIVHIRKGSSMRVKRADTITPVEQAIKALMQHK